MKRFILFMSTFYASLAVLGYCVNVMAGYVFDHVHSYYGPTPMALDTAIVVAVLSMCIGAISLFEVRMRTGMHERGA